MTQINRTTLKAIRADLDAALLAVATKHGVLFNLGALKFNDVEAHGTLRITPLAAGSSAIDQLTAGETPKNVKAAEDYKKMAGMFGLDLAWLDREFNMAGSKFTLIGLLPNKHKNVCLIRRVSTGKQFIASSDAIQAAFGSFSAD